MKNSSALFVNLTPEDYSRFEHAGIGYSGATGAHTKPEDYNGLAPYIASFEYEISRAVVAMGWEKFSVEEVGGQWIVRCERRELPRRRNNIETYIAIAEEQLTLARADSQSIPVTKHVAVALDSLVEAVKVLGRVAGVVRDGKP